MTTFGQSDHTCIAKLSARDHVYAMALCTCESRRRALNGVSVAITFVKQAFMGHFHTCMIG